MTEVLVAAGACVTTVVAVCALFMDAAKRRADDAKASATLDTRLKEMEGNLRTSLAESKGEIMKELALNEQQIGNQARNFGEELKKQSVLTSDLRQLMGQVNVTIAGLVADYRRLEEHFKTLDGRVERIECRVDRIDSVTASHAREISAIRDQRKAS